MFTSSLPVHSIVQIRIRQSTMCKAVPIREHRGRVDLRGSPSLFQPLDAFVIPKAHLNAVAQEKSRESLPPFRMLPGDFLSKSAMNLRRISIAYHLDLITA